MDSAGRIIFAKHNQLLGGNVKVAIGMADPFQSSLRLCGLLTGLHTPPSGLGSLFFADQGVADGERLAITTKELGTCEFYPRTLKHNWNGRFIVAQGDSDFVISTALEA